jgi:hypothetical protein
MTEQPEHTETEDELAGTERHQDEEAMRGPEHHDPPRSEDVRPEDVDEEA